MKKMIVYEAQDGRVFETSKECQTHEQKSRANVRLFKLIDQQIPYEDNKKIVLDFLAENQKELAKLLPIISA